MLGSNPSADGRSYRGKPVRQTTPHRPHSLWRPQATDPINGQYSWPGNRTFPLKHYADTFADA